jgi:hypothetical protein
MKRSTALLALVLGVLGPPAGTAAEPAIPLRVLYVGNARGTRAEAFAAFLRQHFQHVTVAGRDGFLPAMADPADVVLFDWSQSEGDLRTTSVPLGRPEAWSKPTVLINHAGLLVATHWGLIGGAG